MLPIVKYPNPILTTPCALVEAFDDSLHEILDRMPETMKAHQGAGLAANQIGVAKRFFIMLDNKGAIREFINPEILDRSAENMLINEGCLSAPGAIVQVPTRSQCITVRAKDRHGNEFAVVCEDFEAVCVQHEIDHLDGIFYLDKTSRNQRRAALRDLGLK